MSYTITKTNGDALVSVPDTELNTSYGITLVGRNYSGYGIYLNDNFVSLMENFAKDTAPATPLEGQLWWNSNSNDLQVWQGNVWKKIGHVTASGTAPSAAGRNVGDLWWDTTNQQLKAWAGELTANSTAVYGTPSDYVVSLVTSDNVRVGDILSTANVLSASQVTVTQILSTSNVRVGTPVTVYAGEVVTFTRGTGWNLIGPSYTKDQQLTGIFPRTITDSRGITRVVGLIYQKGSVIGAISRENEYAPGAADAIDRLPLIKPGITLIEDSAPQFVRSVLIDTTGSAGNTVVSVTNTDGLAIGDYVITDSIAFSALRTIQEIYANGSIRINATTSLMQNDVIVFQRGLNQSNMFHGTVTNAQRLNGVTADRFATLDTDQTFLAGVGVSGNLEIGQTQDGIMKSTVWSENANLHIINTQANGNIIVRTLSSAISGTPIEALKINGVTGLAEVYGAPTSVRGIATKGYADNNLGTALSALTANVNALINGASADKRDFGNVATILNNYATNFQTINNVLASKANIDAQQLTGVVTADTPAEGTNTTQLATTEFVTRAVGTASAAQTANAVAQSLQIQARATINSPDFSGTPQTTHVSDSDRSRRIATTAFVGNLIDSANNGTSTTLASKAPLDSPDFTGAPTGPTVGNLTFALTPTTVTPNILPITHPSPQLLATVGFVANSLARMPIANLQAYATKISPVLEGSPTAPTPPGNSANTQIATTKFVADHSPVLSVNGYTDVVVLGVADISGAAPINNPAFTGNVVAPKPDFTANSTQVATTNWVKDLTTPLAPKSNPTFINTVTIPTPADNSNDTTAASTAWVRARIATASVPKWDGATKYVSPNAPINTDGVDGDIWFQYVQ